MYIISWAEVSLFILTFSFSFFLFDYCRTEVLGHSVLKFKIKMEKEKRKGGKVGRRKRRREKEKERQERKMEKRYFFISIFYVILILLNKFFSLACLLHDKISSFG